MLPPLQGCPHAKPSAHIVGLVPPGQEVLHGPVEEQCTRQLPLHVTSLLPVDVQVTVLPSPTVGAQSLTLVQT
jgi:hypothetical protein